MRRGGGGDQGERPRFRQSKNNLSDFNWIFDKTPKMSVEDKLNRRIR